MKQNRNRTIDRLRQAVAGITKHFASAPNIVLGGQSTTPKDVVTTLTGVIDTVDAAVAAGKAFHTATAAQHAAIAKGDALLVELKTLVKSQLGSTDAVLGDFGFSNPKRTAPDPATKTAAVARERDGCGGDAHDLVGVRDGERGERPSSGRSPLSLFWCAAVEVQGANRASSSCDVHILGRTCSLSS